MKETLQNRLTKANRIIKTSNNQPPTTETIRKPNMLITLRTNSQVSTLWREGATSTPRLVCCQTWEVSGLAVEGNVSQFPWFVTPEGKQEGGGCLSTH